MATSIDPNVMREVTVLSEREQEIARLEMLRQHKRHQAHAAMFSKIGSPWLYRASCEQAAADLNGPALDFGKLVVCGIYLIEFDGTGHAYIGQAGCILQRMAMHVTDLAKGSHHNEFMQGLYAQHGPASLRCRVLEECPASALAERERAWIERLNPTLNVDPMTIRSRREAEGRLTGDAWWNR